MSRRLIGLIGSLFLLIAVLAWMASGDDTSSTPTPFDYSIVMWGLLVLATIAAVAVAIWQWPHLKSQLRPTKKMTVFGLWVIFIYIAAVVMWPELRTWLFPGGLGLLILFLGMVVVLSLVVDVFKESWITAAILAIITVLVIDPGLMRQIPQEFKERFHTSCYSSPPTRAEMLYDRWTNPSNCDLTIAVTKGAVRLTWNDGETIVHPGDVLPKRTYVVYLSAEPVGGPAQWVHRICDPSRAVAGTWNCS